MAKRLLVASVVAVRIDVTVVRIDVTVLSRASIQTQSNAG